MNPRLRNILAPAVVFAAVAAVTLLAGEAAADRTVVLLSAQAEVLAMEFTPQAQADGGVAVDAIVTGRTRQSDGGFSTIARHSIRLPHGDSIGTSVKALAAGDALTFWKGREGL